MKTITKVLLLLFLMAAIGACSQQPYNNHHSTMWNNQDHEFSNHELSNGGGRGGMH
ncbi:MAG: hypothetical protein WBB23_21760 [Desulforhopalus sp.]